MPIGFLTDAERNRVNRFPIDVAPTDLLAYFTLSETDLEGMPIALGVHPSTVKSASGQGPARLTVALIAATTAGKAQVDDDCAKEAAAELTRD
jgi:hypothetical protein